MRTVTGCDRMSDASLSPLCRVLVLPVRVPVRSQPRVVPGPLQRGLFAARDPQGGLADGPKFVAAPKKANALTDKPARGLVGGTSGTQQQGDGRLALAVGAVEVEAYPSGSGSLRGCFVVVTHGRLHLNLVQA